MLTFSHPGSRGKKGHPIPDPDPQHWDPGWRHFGSWLRDGKSQIHDLPHCFFFIFFLLMERSESESGLVEVNYGSTA
jgi:hypothetical protein